MNLADFILTPFEEDVINKLDEAYKDSIKFYLSLWYDDGDLQPKILKDFLLKYENRLHYVPY